MRSCVGLEINSTNTNKMKNKLIIECIALLNTANYDSETLSEKRTEIVESLKEQLRIGGVMPRISHFVSDIGQQYQAEDEAVEVEIQDGNLRFYEIGYDFERIYLTPIYVA